MVEYMEQVDPEQAKEYREKKEMETVRERLE